jgi:RNA polymerase sigma factor (sigma-70 family)
MTAVPDWDLADPHSTDAELVRGSIAGDRAAFAQIYDRYADRLYDFCVGMLRDRDGAADCVQDTFCLAGARLPQLREPDRLRPWLYSIARNEALRRLRDQRRETPTDELPDIPSDQAGPDALAARTELAELIDEVAGGLSDRDRAVFDLAFRHGLDGPDLAEALAVSHSNANTVVHRLKGTVERSLGALLIARQARSRPGECADLDEILASWDGHFTVLMRKRVARHIESCPICDDERRRLVSPAALLGAAPVFIPAPAWLRDKTLRDIQLVCHTSAMAPASVEKSIAGRRRKWILAAVLLLAVGGASAGLALVWLNKGPVSIAPAEVSEPAPAPVGQTPPPVAPLPPVTPPLQLLPVQPPTPTQNTAPVSPPFVDEQPAVSEPSTEVAPPPAATSPKVAAPTQRPPMSFSPTAIAPQPAPPTPGGNGGSRSPTGGP